MVELPTDIQQQSVSDTHLGVESLFKVSHHIIFDILYVVLP